MRIKLAKFAFGSAFCIAVPAVMIALSLYLDGALNIPMPFPWWVGMAPALIGAGLTAAGLVSIKAVAGVWPMNAFPPAARRVVDRVTLLGR